LVVTLVSLLALSGCGGDDESSSSSATNSSELENVRLMLPYRDSIIFPGLMIAKDRYFAEEGLDVETLPSDGSSFVIQQLIAGNVDYGLADAANTLIANSKGADLRAIMMVDRNVFTIVTPEDSGIDSIDDLKGKSLGITEAGGGEAPLVEAALRDAGLQPGDDVELVPVGEGGPTSYRALKSGRVQAFAGAYNDLAALEVEGLKFKPIVPEKYTNLPAGHLLVTQSTLDDEQKRETAIKLARAWYKGVVFAEENPDAAYAIICKQVPPDCEGEEVAKGMLNQVLGLVEQPSGEWGQLDLDRWETVRETFLPEDVRDDVDVESVALNDYIDEINDFDEDEIREQAREEGS
jgi:NitT/TauT family transport system substrate-binding protein